MDHPFGSYLKNRTWQDLFRETAPCCLRAEDRQCAAFGLEHFDPFLDERLLKLMFRVPGTLKIRDGVTKILLRRAMPGILPEETRTRVKKTGWNAPAHVWFTGRNAVALRDLVASRAFRERGIYNPLEVDRLVREHEEIVASGEARENHMMFLWQLINLESWLQAFRIHSWA
jgi:asparagine synthase (glutamine-hydrolysing)